jgi:predicted hotdog family 3-hydroxylacyl-ACP dehydratase
MIDFDNIKQLLPHGASAVGISSILDFYSNKVVATANIGQSLYMLDELGHLIPEAILELIGQAAAIGGNCSDRGSRRQKDNQSVYSEPADVRRIGVITRVRSLWVQRNRQYAIGEQLIITAQWSEPVGKVFELQGEVKSVLNDEIIAKADCTVLEMM